MEFQVRGIYHLVSARFEIYSCFKPDNSLLSLTVYSTTLLELYASCRLVSLL